MTIYPRRGLMKTPTKSEIQAFVDAGFTVADIAIYNKWSVSKVRYWLKKFDLKATRETSSIGAKSFKILLQQAFPAFPLEEEFHIGGRLRLDFYIPGLYTAFEVDGSPHDELVPLFHGDEEAYKRSRDRDKKKDKFCEDNNILLIRITAKLAVEASLNPELRAEVVDNIRDRIAEESPTGPVFVMKEEPVSDRYTQYQEDMKRLGREARKKNYRRAKALKDKLKKRHQGQAFKGD